jgi:glucose-1-phosphate thymidylyltransferase
MGSMVKKAILLAGGTGSRLLPLTAAVNKHLLPVNGKFIIDYPLATLQAMGIKNLTVVLGGDHFSQVVDHCTDGKQWGIDITYRYQGAAKGIAQAIAICKDQVDNQQEFCVILGDNIFERSIEWNTDYACAQIALYKHPELQRFGVASLDPKTKRIVQVEEKPKELDPQYDQRAITGAYLFDSDFFEFFKELKPSARGEYEICDIIHRYWQEGLLHYTEIEGLWGDAGTHDSIAFWNDYLYRKGQ